MKPLKVFLLKSLLAILRILGALFLVSAVAFPIFIVFHSNGMTITDFMKEAAFAAACIAGYVAVFAIPMFLYFWAEEKLKRIERE